MENETGVCFDPDDERLKHAEKNNQDNEKSTESTLADALLTRFKKVKVTQESRGKLSWHPEIPEGSPKVHLLKPTKPPLSPPLLKDLPSTFLDAQLRVIRKELQSAMQDGQDREEKIIQLEKQLKDTEQERAKLSRENTTKHKLIENYQSSSEQHRLHVSKLEQQCSKQKKELELLKQQLKETRTVKDATEVKLNRVLEENRKHLTDLQLLKITSEDVNCMSKKLIEELTTDNSKLKKEKEELVVAFKKQMGLIDNLKRQKLHLEAGIALQFTEKEFMKALDWGF